MPIKYGANGLHDGTDETKELAFDVTGVTTGTTRTVTVPDANVDLPEINLTATSNIGLGTGAVDAITTGNYNVGLGDNALTNNTTGVSNTAIGTESGYSVTTGDENTFVGRGAGYYMTTGSNNSILGRYNGNQGGLDIRTASNYIVLSDGDGNPRQIIDNNGNMGLGVTPESWDSTHDVLQIGQAGSLHSYAANNYTSVMNNAYTNGATWKYINADEAQWFRMDNDGTFQFLVAGDGTLPDDPITWKTALNIANNGDISFYEDTGTTPKLFWDASAESLGIGTSTVDKKLHIEETTASTACYAKIEAASWDAGLQLTSGTSTWDILNDYDQSNMLRFWNGSYHLNLDSNGNMGLGVTPESGWHSDPVVFHFGPTGSLLDWTGGAVELSSNYYYSTSDKYLTTDYASQYRQSAGEHLFKVAPSGTADTAITWKTPLIIGNNEQLRIQTSTNVNSLNHDVQHASFTDAGYRQDVTRAASTGYNFTLLYSGGGADLEFQMRGDGNAWCDGSWTGGGADYAEYFEWADGNPANEDRRGYPVTLVNDKIQVAVAGDNIIGVISANPSVVGDGDIDRWKGKYLRDDFGAYIYEPYSVTEWDEQVVDVAEHTVDVPAVLDDGGNIIEPATTETIPTTYKTEKQSYHTDAIPTGVTVPADAVVITHDDNGTALERRKLNPAYDETQAYISREDRPEWATVGLMGKLRIRKGQPTNSNWIKMRTVSDTVEEWLVK